MISDFLRSNQIIDGKLVSLKRRGKKNVTQKPTIKEEHRQKL